MIIVLKPEASKADADAILARIAAAGLKPLYMPGTERTVLGALGDERVLGQLHIESNPAVERVTPILTPFKLVSREMHPEDTVVAVGALIATAMKVRSNLELTVLDGDATLAALHVDDSNRDLLRSVERPAGRATGLSLRAEGKGNAGCQVATKFHVPGDLLPGWPEEGRAARVQVPGEGALPRDGPEHDLAGLRVLRSGCPGAPSVRVSP